MDFSGKFLRLACSGVVAGGLLLHPSAAKATPPDPGVKGEVVWKERVDDRDLIVRRLTLPPGTDTGWHFHDGPLFAEVKAGTLSQFGASCKPAGVYSAGDYLLEPGGPDDVHIGRNLGDTELVLEVYYVQPAGSPPARNAANPGCAFE
jgi:quercetin dioxygenase-like cupin family protein